jgi:PqqD family protein of HPr-rel-A system
MKPLRRPDVVVKELGDETLLYNAEGKSIHVLNPTAHVIWQHCDGDHDVHAIEDALRSSFSVPEDHDVQADIQRTLDEFRDKGLLQDQPQH